MATYIAHGDVALSVLMTTASTVGAIFMTPLLTKFLAGALVPVDAGVRPRPYTLNLLPPPPMLNESITALSSLSSVMRSWREPLYLCTAFKHVKSRVSGVPTVLSPLFLPLTS